METATMPLMWWLITVVTMGFLWLVTVRGRVLEMAVALLVLLMEQLQLVNVSACFCYWTFLIPSLSNSTHPPAITCPGVPTPINGSIEVDGVSQDENSTYICADVATYSCDTGFSLVGNNSRTCAGDGSSITGAFDGEAPICDGE